MSPQFAALGVAVSDMDAAVAFYELMGLRFGPDDSGEGHREAELPGGLRFMLDTEAIMESFDQSWERPTGRGRIGLAFECNGSSDVDATYERIVSAGHASHLEPFDAFWGQRYAAVVDPDGNVVDLFAALDRT